MRIPVRISPAKKRFPATPAPPPATTTPIGGGHKGGEALDNQQGKRRTRSARKARKMQLAPQAKAHRARQKEPRSRSAAPAVTPLYAPRGRVRRAPRLNAPHSPAPRRGDGRPCAAHTPVRAKRNAVMKAACIRRVFGRITRRGQGRKENVSAHPAERSSVQCRDPPGRAIRRCFRCGGRSRRLSTRRERCRPPGRAPTPL